MALKTRYTVVNGEVLSENRGGTIRDYVPDPLGSTVALLDSTQTQQTTFSYWPYGEVKASTGSTVTPFQYGGTRGYYRDSASKTYVRARYLDTQKGRWLTRDPLYPSEPEYQYSQSSPASFFDLSGLKQTLPYPGLPRSRKNCQLYQNLCNQGYLFACNAWYACMGTDNSPNENCMRQCLQDQLKKSYGPGGTPTNLTCGAWINQHTFCFNRCHYGNVCTNRFTLAPLCNNLLVPYWQCAKTLQTVCRWSPPGGGIQPPNGTQWRCLGPNGPYNCSPAPWWVQCLTGVCQFAINPTICLYGVCLIST